MSPPVPHFQRMLESMRHTEKRATGAGKRGRNSASILRTTPPGAGPGPVSDLGLEPCGRVPPRPQHGPGIAARSANHRIQARSTTKAPTQRLNRTGQRQALAYLSRTHFPHATPDANPCSRANAGKTLLANLARDQGQGARKVVSVQSLRPQVSAGKGSPRVWAMISSLR
jgi:hypothetical protein